jgi:hypothetical protein
VRLFLLILLAIDALRFFGEFVINQDRIGATVKMVQAIKKFQREIDGRCHIDSIVLLGLVCVDFWLESAE